MVGWTRMIRRIGCLLVVAALASCDSVSGPPVVCPAIAEPAVSVTTLNAKTEAPIGDVLVVARDGSYADSARTRISEDGDPISANLGLERPGTYELTAEKEGFSTWSRSGVVAEEGECGPETVEITARLTSLSS